MSQEERLEAAGPATPAECRPKIRQRSTNNHVLAKPGSLDRFHRFACVHPCCVCDQYVDVARYFASEHAHCCHFDGAGVEVP